MLEGQLSLVRAKARALKEFIVSSISKTERERVASRK